MLVFLCQELWCVVAPHTSFFFTDKSEVVDLYCQRNARLTHARFISLCHAFGERRHK